ncbi:pyridoxamine 5'-phosphate oxidase family protein [Chitinophaga sp.]|uniref:pyridoxamine 5'-phosphate oxidase family protein n=1 Tax=Chitinophaga sp. TaxID=1869181 RepID=UPI0031E25950
MIGKLSDQQMQTILQQNMMGRIGCSSHSKIFVVPVCYAYNGKAIIAHSAEGMKINMMRNNPQVCFEVDEVTSLTNWRSVIIWGQYQEILDERERFYSVKFLMSRLLQYTEAEKVHHAQAIVADEDTGHFNSNIRPVVYRITIEEMTGRFEHGDLLI